MTLPISTLRIGDQVLVIAGAERGKQARIIGMKRRSHAALLDGVNLVTRHAKATAKLPQGGRLQQPSPIHWSNLQLVCPSCNKPTHVATKLTDAGVRERICRLCKAPIPRKERA